MGKIDHYGIQLYGVRDFMTNEEDIKETFAKLKKMGYSQVQTAGCAISYKRFGELAKEAGLEIVGTHDSFDMMLNDFEQSLENHRLLGTTNMGIGGMKCGSVDELARFIENANIVAEKAAKNGMKFTYHHHSHEFIRRENGKTTMDMLIEGLDRNNTSFVLDTYWIQHAGGDVKEWIRKLEGRIDIIHLKDMKVVYGGDNVGYVNQFAEIGSGNMNWESIIDTAQECNVRYYVVEQDYYWETTCFLSAKQSINYLKSLQGGNEHGKGYAGL